MGKTNYYDQFLKQIQASDARNRFGAQDRVGRKQPALAARKEFNARLAKLREQRNGLLIKKQ